LLFSALNFCPHSPVTQGSIIFINLELLLEVLFKPGQHLNPEHKYKYVYLLAYAASVHETWIEVVFVKSNKFTYLFSQETLKSSQDLV